MRVVRHFQILIAALLLLAIFSGQRAIAQDGRKIEVVPQIAHTVLSIAFSPDSSHVLSAGEDNTIKLWETATGALLRTIVGHSGRVWSVAFSPDGSRALSGSEDKTIKLWDAATGVLVRTFEGHSNVSSVAFSPDGGRVLAGNYDSTVKLWDAATGALVRAFEGHSLEVSSSSEDILRKQRWRDDRIAALVAHKKRQRRVS